MIKQSIILLSLFLNTFSDSARILPEYSVKNLTITERMLILMLEKCNLGFNNTIYYTGNNAHLTEALLTTLSPVDLKSWILSTTEYIEFGRLTTFNGFVVVFNSHNEWAELMINIIVNWKCIENCKVIFLSKFSHSCRHGEKTISTLGFSYFDEAYYICVQEMFGPIVLTLDKYRNGRQPFWYRLQWKVNSLYPGSFYFRKYDADLCHNLNFSREKPKKNIHILVGYKRKVTSETDMLPDFITRKVKFNDTSLFISLLEKALKIKFSFYIKSYLYRKGQNSEALNPFLWSSTSVDMMLIPQHLVINNQIVYLHPISYTTFIILSHKQAEATPLEKIAKFYGIWTLISLIILLIITFVVIYLKSNRNAALAAFDILRLLINSGVEIPINTLSLKIFFCMIFLYFTVIQSTFSGNLPRFLTIPEIHDTIDSLEDISNPRISTIYDAGFYDLDNKSTNEVIRRKRKHLRDRYDLIDHFIADQNSVCITDKQFAVNLLQSKKFISKVHISKNDFGDIISANVVRYRFFLQEKFKWATTYIFDVGLHISSRNEAIYSKRIIENEKIRSRIDFRKISVGDLKFAFIFLSIGNTLGFVCFLFELVIHKKYNPKNSFEFFKKSMTIKRQKTYINIRRISVKPRQSEPELKITEIA